MSDVILSAELQAKVDKFIASLLSAANAADSTDKSVTQMSTDISKNIANVNRLNLSGFQNSLKQGQISINNFSATTAKIPAVLPKITVGSNQAAFALSNLGRVAQDAPFGFIGIQNNLNPLLESFQRLRAETGSNSGALKALGQSLIGPAGLGLALSLVSSAILIYQQYQQKANKATNDAKKGADDYISTLDQLTQVQLKGAQNAQKELTDLKILYGITQNTTLSLKQRNDAVDELQKKYPSYLGNISNENILNGKAKAAYDLLTQSIIATAKARAAEDLITKNSQRQLENEQKINDNLVQYDKQRLIARKALAELSDPSKAGSARFNADQAARAEERQADAAKVIRDLKRDSQILDERNLKLTEAITEQVKKGADLTGKDAALKIKPERIDLELPENQSQIFEELFKKISALNAPAALRIPIPKKIKFTDKIDIGDAVTIDPEALAKRIKDLDLEAKIQRSIESAQQKLADFFKFENINATIAEGLGGAFESIGTAFANGTSIIDAAGASILGSIGGILVQFGSLTLAAGIAATALGKALSNPLNPASAAAAIAAGAALIVIGGAVKAFSSSIGKGGDGKSQGEGVKPIRQFASGGYNLPAGMALVGERGPEIVNLPTGASVNNNRTSMDMLSGMGGNNVEINADFDIGLEKLYVRLQAVGKKLNRRG